MDLRDSLIDQTTTISLTARERCMRCGMPGVRTIVGATSYHQLLAKYPDGALGEILEEHFGELRPVNGTRHGGRLTFVFKDPARSEQVFIRRDAQKAMLQAPYDGPYTVVSRDDKVFVVLVYGKEVTISIDRLKPAYTLAESTTEDETPEPVEERTEPRADTEDAETTAEEGTAPVLERSRVTTRAGRRVRFPERFRAGLR